MTMIETDIDVSTFEATRTTGERYDDAYDPYYLCERLIVREGHVFIETVRVYDSGNVDRDRVVAPIVEIRSTPRLFVVQTGTGLRDGRYGRYEVDGTTYLIPVPDTNVDPF